MIEEWKDIIGYEGLYQVSNLGNVKSLRFDKEKMLKQNKDSHNYLSINLYKNKTPKTFNVHKLIAMAFLNHIFDGTHKLVVDHIDNDKSNNHLENLRIISNRENTTKESKGVSKKVGVSFCKTYNKWISRIRYKGKSIF